MKLDLTLTLNEGTEKERLERIKEKQRQVERAKYEPTWKEVWFTGYTTHTGRRKEGIFCTNLSPLDRERLEEVKAAIEQGELSVEVDTLRKFTKAHALRLFQVLKEKQRQTSIDKLIANKPPNYYTITEEDDFYSLLSDLKKEPIFAIDTETTGLNIFRDKIVGVSLTLPKADYHVYIPVGHTEGKQLKRSFVLANLFPILEGDQGKVLHNAKYDIHMFLRHGIRLNNVVHDTMIAMAILNENEPSFALKNLATKYGRFFGFEDKSATYEELFGKGGFQDTPIEIGSIYACKDTHLTWRFYQFQMEQFQRLPELYKVYKEIEHPVLYVSVEMEQNGFLIDKEYSKSYETDLRDRINKIETILKKWLGDTNLNSPAQLQETLYDRLGLPDPSGKRSTEAKALKKLKDEHPAIPYLLEYRESSKLLGTYVETLPKQIEEDGRLHGQFNQVATVTGRFASRNPNLQNLPVEARKMIVAPKGKVLIGIDYSQIEPRVLAHMSGDKNMQDPYLKGWIYIPLWLAVFSKCRLSYAVMDRNTGK